MADPICTCSYDEGGGVMLRSRTCPYATHASEADSSAPSGNGTLYIGLLLGLLLYGLLRGGSVALGWIAGAANKQGYWALGLPMNISLIALAVVVVAMLLLIMARTRKLGLGLIISLAAGLIVDGSSYAGLLVAG